MGDVAFRRWLCGVFALFASLRLAVYLLFPMDWSLVYWRWQNLDVAELRENFVEAIFHCHQQPPLWNVFVALNVKIFPDSFGAIPFQCEYAILSIGAFFLMLSILRQFNFRKGVMLLAMGLYSILPAVLYSERWLAYTFPLTFMLLLCTKLMLDTLTKTGVWRFYALCLALACVVLSRSFFHVFLWMLPLLLLGLFGIHSNGEKISRHVVFPLICLLVAILPYFMNFARYGIFSSSTWLGANLARTLRYVTPAEKSRLYEQGLVSELAMEPPFSSDFERHERLLGAQKPTGISILDKRLKSATHPNRKAYVNMNNRTIPWIAKEQAKLWKVAIIVYPGKYLLAVSNAIFMFFSEGMDLYWNTGHWFPWHSDSRCLFILKTVRYLFAPVGVFMFMMFGVLGFLRAARMPATRVFALFCLFNVMYVFGVSCCFELGEQLVMRVPIEPLIVIGIAFLVSHILNRPHQP